METITISKDEFIRLKQCELEENDLIKKIARGIEDIQKGRIKNWEEINSKL